MFKATRNAMLGMALALTTVSTANAAVITIPAGEITVSQSWTANNEYRLAGLVYVRNGATITIEAGTKIASTAGVDGTLVITRGSKIYALGTATKPIIFTSTNDNGTSRVASNEWGNLTILGNGLISASHSVSTGTAISHQDGAAAPVVVNTGTPTGLNKTTMEGLTAGFVGDGRVLYGGNDDNDDSGTLAYVSLRYGGKTLSVGVELNGLSLGGVGRETDIHHVDIWNNLDDGIEIWGGTVNLKYISIWNIGDDSLDLDQGWRGKAQFGLIVQGYSNNAGQGGGVGDNAIEIDGAERSDAQPVTTSVIYNFTVIGQPGGVTGPGFGGDFGTAWRDNARVQIRNCIFMDLGDSLVATETSEAQAGGYGLNGTLSYLSTWSTPFSHSHNPATTINGLPGDTAAILQARYPVQTDGFLSEITNSVFFRNNAAAAYTNANGSDAVGVTTAPGASNPAKANVVATISPIAALTREPEVTVPGSTNRVMLPVLTLDPRASTAGDAITSLSAAPNDGFFTPAKFRGGFSDKNNWARGWTAADQYGKFVGAVNPAPAAVDVQVLLTTTTFQTAVGFTYTVESSTDGINWSPAVTVVGDGTLKTVQTVVGAGFVSSSLYRVVIQ